MKKFLTLTLTLATLACSLALAANAAFATTRNYEGQFTDVSDTAWYAPSVKTCYEIGLINGASATSFNPQGMFTLAEAATIAARMHNIYNGGNGTIPTVSGAWYNGAVNYCIANGIFEKGEFNDYTRYATRAEAAAIMVAALPAKEWTAINSVNSLPDVENDGGKNSAAIFTLYNAGILAGSDEYGKFQPNAAITRAELAALVVRMADTSKRLSVNLKPLSEKPAVKLVGDFVKVTPDGKIIVLENNKYGVMSVYGDTVLPIKYDGIDYFENGRFCLYLFDGEKTNYMIADTNGKILYTYTDYPNLVVDDYYVINPSVAGTDAVLYNGNKVIAKDFTDVEHRGEFFILEKAISYSRTAFALIDKTGKLLFDYVENQWFIFTDEYIVIRKYPTFSYYDKNSYKLISSGNYEEVNETSSLAKFTENGKYGLAGPTGKITEALYDNVELYGDFAILNYGTMSALAGKNGIIFDLGKYSAFRINQRNYASAKRDGGVDIVDVTGDVLASLEGEYESDYGISGDLIRFGYTTYNLSNHYRHEYNYAYDTVSKEILKYTRTYSSNYNYESYYKNDNKCILEDGTEVEGVYVTNGLLTYKSLDGKYGLYWIGKGYDAIYDTPEEAVTASNSNSKNLFYTVTMENGKPVVKYGDDVVIQYYQAPFYFDYIAELGYNNYYICTFNNVNYIVHP